MHQQHESTGMSSHGSLEDREYEGPSQVSSNLVLLFQKGKLRAEFRLTT